MITNKALIRQVRENNEDMRRALDENKRLKNALRVIRSCIDFDDKLDASIRLHLQRIISDSLKRYDCENLL